MQDSPVESVPSFTDLRLSWTKRWRRLGAATYERLIMVLGRLEQVVVALGLCLGLLVGAAMSLLIVGLVVGCWKLFRE